MPKTRRHTDPDPDSADQSFGEEEKLDLTGGEDFLKNIDIVEAEIAEEFEDDDNLIELEEDLSFENITILDDEDEDELSDDVEDVEDWEDDLSDGTLIDTQHTDGHTYDPEEAWEQGLVYTPPDDPPVAPSDSDQGIEVTTGFAPSMAQSNPDLNQLPDNVDNNDLDLEEDVYITLRNTSETVDLADRITITVEDGVVTLEGTVLNDADIALVDEVVTNVPGVVEVENLLEVAD
jgi:hypothetical protein